MNRRGFLGSCLAAVFGAGATRGSVRTVSGDALLGEQTTFSSAGVPLPSVEDLRRLSQAEGWSLADADLAVFRETMSRLLAGYPALESTPEPALPPRYPRTGTTHPTPKDNPLNAWAVKTSIKGASRGLLSGRTVAVKDNVCVAGVPMMNGSRLLDGFVPATDASIVTRLLDAGAEIVGKANCEAFCFSAGSHTSDPAPVLNPHDPTRSAGGSSSGSAALVASRACDMAIGGDQGGSIRIPAALCGIVGLKPTWGLVPYTGIVPIELTIDHTGPMARTTRDCALLLDVIAGPDGLDPRQSAALQPQRYSELLEQGAKGLRFGVMKEGFELPNADPEVNGLVRVSVQRFTGLGANVRDVSVPLHPFGRAVWVAIAAEGGLDVVANAMGTNWKGHYTTELVEFYTRRWQERANDVPDTVKLVVLAGRWVRQRTGGRYYAKAQNQARALRAAYDAALHDVDLLVMPTVGSVAPKLPLPGSGLASYLAEAFGPPLNTQQFDVTGHPAISVPCGKIGRMPGGMMLVGRHGEDATVLRAAHAFEQLGTA